MLNSKINSDDEGKSVTIITFRYTGINLKIYCAKYNKVNNVEEHGYSLT